MIIIKETRADDIRAAKQKWDSDFDKAVDDYNRMEYEYDVALEDVMEKVEAQIKSELGISEDSLLEVDVDAYGSRWGSKYRTGIKYKYGTPYDNKSALKWNIDIYLNNDGEVQKETGSWSGLEAHTPELLEDLKYSVNLIEKIMNLDYQKIIMDAESRRPNRDDYVVNKRPNYKERPNFEAQIKEVTIEDIMGTDTIISGSAVPSSGYRTVSGWYKILGQTAKRYKVSFVPDRTGTLTNQDLKNEFDKGYNEFQVNKDTLYQYIGDNFETKEL